MTPIRYAIAVALAVLGVSVGAPSIAHADLLAEDDAIELAQLLADASEEQGVCYGWEVRVDDLAGAESSLEEGSSFGPETALETGVEEAEGEVACDEEVELRALLTYTTEWQEEEDSVQLDVRTSSGAIGVEDIERLGFGPEDLLGDKDDAALFNMVAGLPLLAVDADIASRPVPYEPPSSEEQRDAAEEQPTSSPGSDWWRMYWWVPVLVAPIGIFALVWLAAALSRHARSRRERQ